jgi:outer membrane protein assembly factor BamB
MPHSSSVYPRVISAAVFILAGLYAGVDWAIGGDWPQWRGPRRNAVSEETGLLHSWSEGGPQLAWQADGLGSGYSSVVVSRGLVFTIGRSDGDVLATAHEEATGKLAWACKIGTTARNPCSTPTVDGERTYALDPDGELVCLNSATGEIVWQKSYVDDFQGRMMSGRGFGESPLVDGEKLIITPGGPEAALVALEKHTGKPLWKSTLPDIGSAGRDGAGFSSVVVTEAAGIRQYVQLLGRGLAGFAAKDGRFLWSHNAISNQTANIPTPVVRDDLVFAANGYNAGSVLLRLVRDDTPGAVEPGIKAEVVYSLGGGQFQNHHGGVVLVGDSLYGGHGSNNGLPTRVDLLTGRIVWKRRGPGVGSAAVVLADGRLYFRYQNGVVALIEPSAGGFEVKGTLQIPGAGGDSWAHPVVANGRLFLREQDTLWVYDVVHEPGTTKPVDSPAPLANGDAAASALRKLGIAVEPIASDAFDRPEESPDPAATSAHQRRRAESRRLFAYAVGEIKDGSSRPLAVVLTEKHISRGAITSEVLGHLKNFRRPIVLNLAGTSISGEGLGQLTDLESLVGLSLEFCEQVSDAALNSLQSFEQLRVLVLAGTEVSDVGMRHLTKLKNLTALDLEVCDGITDAACEPLGEMRQLKALVFKKTGFEPNRISDAGLARLKNLSDLELLNLYGNNLTDAGLVHLESLTKLRELNLSLLAITDKGLVHLKPLANLRQLDLLYSEGFAGPLLTDSGLEGLRPLSNLNSLNLTGANLSDSGLERLTVLKKLTALSLARTPTTAAGIRKLENALPNCEVVK